MTIVLLIGIAGFAVLVALDNWQSVRVLEGKFRDLDRRHLVLLARVKRREEAT